MRVPRVTAAVAIAALLALPGRALGRDGGSAGFALGSCLGDCDDDRRAGSVSGQGNCR